MDRCSTGDLAQVCRIEDGLTELPGGASMFCFRHVLYGCFTSRMSAAEAIAAMAKQTNAISYEPV